MKLLVLCLLAVCCCSLVSTSPISRRRLQEIQQNLNDVKKKLEQSEHMFHTPPQNTEDCCSLSALRCFREELEKHPGKTDIKTKKLIDGLRKSSTEQSMNFCDSSNTTATSCQACDSHPKENAAVFFGRLESRVQRAMSTLNNN